jgi:hypothetical protein
VVGDFIYKVALTPHQVHQIGISLTNGANTGNPTTELNNLALFLNNTAVPLADPEALGQYGSFGFRANSLDTMPTNISVTHNIVYRNGGLSQNLSTGTLGTYMDPNPGTVDFNLLFQNVSKSTDPIFGSQPLDANSLFVDPLFVDSSKGNYMLQSNSPASSVGFSTSNVPLAP